jgi:hypothetical protein
MILLLWHREVAAARRRRWHDTISLLLPNHFRGGRSSSFLISSFTVLWRRREHAAEEAADVADDPLDADEEGKAREDARMSRHNAVGRDGSHALQRAPPSTMLFRRCQVEPPAFGPCARFCRRPCQPPSPHPPCGLGST